MQYFLIFIFSAVSVSSIAEEYFLEIEKACSSSSSGLNFECEAKKDRQLIFSENGKWYGRNPDNIRELSIVKSDDYILVLENPVYFSGTDRIHLLKATGKFYWSQFAYSEVLEESEAHVKYGSIVKVEK